MEVGGEALLDPIAAGVDACSRLREHFELPLPVGRRARLGIARRLQLDGVGAEQLGGFDLERVGVDE